MKKEGQNNENTRFTEILEFLNLKGGRQIELEDVELSAKELVLSPSALPSGLQAVLAPAAVAKVKSTIFKETTFEPFLQEYPGKIREVTLGATSSEGGSRGSTVKIGGASTPAFYLFESTPPNPPKIAIDTFDIKVPLPKAIKAHVKDVWEDQVEWAKKAVDKWGADIVTVHLLSTDPLIEDKPVKEAVKTVEDILQAVDVPLIIGGSGDPKKDAELFIKVCEVAEGERVLLNSLTLDMDEAGVLEGVTKAAQKYNQLVLGFTALDLNRATELNRKLYEYIPENNVLMDLTTAALGYGLEYSFTIHERARITALMGDKELQHPVISGTTNSWAAREAWMTLDPEWEPKSRRGPLWETITALNLLLAGVDIFMMMHPDAIKTMKKTINELMTCGKAQSEKIMEWITQI